MMVIIKRPTTDDEEIFVQLACGLSEFNRPHIWKDDNFEQVLSMRQANARRIFGSSNSDQQIFLTYLDNEPVGYILIYLNDNGFRKSGYIDEIYVSETARGRGVGQALMAAAKEWLQSAGAVRMSLQVYVWNESARAFYEREGFIVNALSYNMYFNEDGQL